MGTWQEGRLQPGPFEFDPDRPDERIHHTGDLAVRSADGVFAVIGRKDRQLKIHGNRIEPAEIEEFLRSQPGVIEAAVVARPRANDDPELIAFVVAETPVPPGLRASLLSAARSGLPSAMQPGALILLTSLPLLPGGKVDAEALLSTPIVT